MLKWLNSDIPVKVDVKGNLSERNLKYLFKVPMKRNFLFFLTKEHKKTAVYRFSISYLVIEIQSFEDPKIKAKSTDTKHVILVTSHTLNKYSLDSQATISPNLPVRTN